MQLLRAVVCAGLAASALAVLGSDVSGATMPSSYSCLKGQGHAFTIIRCYQSNGQTDPNCPHTIYNAWAGGMSDVDVYLFPCFSCGNPAGQVDATVNYLAQYNITTRAAPPGSFGMMWFDIEGPQYWSGSSSANINFLAAMINQANARGQHWNPIMGGSSFASGYPIWYPHYDGNPSFSDWANFGGWSKPSIKQFAGTTDTCGASIDVNWYP